MKNTKKVRNRLGKTTQFPLGQARYFKVLRNSRFWYILENKYTSHNID